MGWRVNNEGRKGSDKEGEMRINRHGATRNRRERKIEGRRRRRGNKKSEKKRGI